MQGLALAMPFGRALSNQYEAVDLLQFPPLPQLQVLLPAPPSCSPTPAERPDSSYCCTLQAQLGRHHFLVEFLWQVIERLGYGHRQWPVSLLLASLEAAVGEVGHRTG